MLDFELPEQILDAVIDWLDVDLGIVRGTYSSDSQFDGEGKRYAISIHLSDAWTEKDKRELTSAFEADKFELANRLLELFPDYKFSVSLDSGDIHKDSEDSEDPYDELDEIEDEDDAAEDDTDFTSEGDTGDSPEYDEDDAEEIGEDSEERQYLEEGLSIVDEEDIEEEEDIEDPEDDDSAGYRAAEVDEDGDLEDEDLDLEFGDSDLTDEYRSDWRKSSGYSLSELWGAFGGGDDE